VFFVHNCHSNLLLLLAMTITITITVSCLTIIICSVICVIKQTINPCGNLCVESQWKASGKPKLSPLPPISPPFPLKPQSRNHLGTLVCCLLNVIIAIIADVLLLFVVVVVFRVCRLHEI